MINKKWVAVIYRMLETAQHFMNECKYPETGLVCSVSQIKHDTFMFIGTSTNMKRL